MENELKLENRIIEFIKRHYQGGWGVPPVRRILREFGLIRKDFYRIFKKGIAEACELAGVPPPQTRIALTKKATVARSQKCAFVTSITLPSDLSEGLLVAGHLESKEPTSVLQDLINVHCMLVKHGFRLSDVEGLIKLAIRAKELDIHRLDRERLDSLLRLLEELENDGWEPAEFVDYATEHYRHIGHLREYVQGMISLEEYMKKEGVS